MSSQFVRHLHAVSIRTVTVARLRSTVRRPPRDQSLSYRFSQDWVISMISLPVITRMYPQKYPRLFSELWPAFRSLLPRKRSIAPSTVSPCRSTSRAYTGASACFTGVVSSASLRLSLSLAVHLLAGLICLNCMTPSHQFPWLLCVLGLVLCGLVLWSRSRLACFACAAHLAPHPVYPQP